MTRKFTKYPSNYVKASFDDTKYHIVGFTPESYERLKSYDSSSSDNTFGYIELAGAPYAIDVTYEDLPQWTVYLLGQATVNDIPYNEDLEIGILDLSLSYDEQLKFLIDTLERVVVWYNK